MCYTVTVLQCYDVMVCVLDFRVLYSDSWFCLAVVPPRWTPPCLDLWWVCPCCLHSNCLCFTILVFSWVFLFFWLMTLWIKFEVLYVADFFPALCPLFVIKLVGPVFWLSLSHQPSETSAQKMLKKNLN